MALHQRFFEAAKLDMASAKVLTEKDLYQPAIYHLHKHMKNVLNHILSLKKLQSNVHPKRLSIITFEVGLATIQKDLQSVC